MSESSFLEVIQRKFDKAPTSGQDHLFRELYAFSVARNEKIAMIVRGYAGTGKTSSMAAYVQALINFKVDVVLLAPTGRAAKVFSQKAGIPAYTIHKHIYRRKSKVDLNSGMSLQPNLFKNTFFLVDEASMIGDYTLQKDGSISSRNLLDDLIEYVYSGVNCKLIFIGDEGQLPPVGADHSPALNAEYIENHYWGVRCSSVSLIEVLRQQFDSDILFNATRLRSIQWDSFPTFELHDKGDLIRINGADLQEYLESSYDKVGQDEAIVVTRSNKQANNYNLQIRGRILWYEEQLCGGDILMVVKNNYYWLGDDSLMGFIANGEQFRVKRVLKTEELYGFEFIYILVQFVDYPDQGEVELIMHSETLFADAPSMSRERMKDLFYAVEQDYLHHKNKKKRYEEILKDPYFNALQVKYAYAVTCHKSQGGQWKHVYIDQGFVNEEMMDSGYYRWLYTALTRATEKVFLVNFADEFFTNPPA